jgi:hypothetical protein
MQSDKEDLQIIIEAIKDQPSINSSVDRRLNQLENSRGGLRDLGCLICFLLLTTLGVGLVFRPGSTTIHKEYRIENRCTNGLLSFGKCENPSYPQESEDGRG